MSSPSPPRQQQSSRSPSPVPTHQHLTKPIPLSTLVSHLLSAKRSLSSINNVWRANEIVTSARAALEESVVLTARTGFLQSGIEEEVGILRRVRDGVEGVYGVGKREFEDVIKTLDAANARLENTMDALRSTMVEAAFRPKEESPRSLLDFVDEHGVETVRDGLKESIRASKEAQTEFDSSILEFDNHMRDLKPSMKAASRSSASQSGTLDSPIPQHLQSLESNAQEMAALLSSLVSHFDLCVNAVRHTEGGYAAVRQAASSQPAGLEPVSVSGVMKSAEESSPELEPISEEERQEMLDVLVKDAEQVEDVVIEMSEFLSEMEQKHEAILEYVSDLNNIYKATLSTFGKLEDISRTLPTYIIASQDFTLRWTEIKYTIDTQLHELENMRLFYESYHSSYDNLLLEVSRRRQTEDKVKNIMRKAMEQVEKVIEGDRVEREAFRMDFGEFLPNDLWSGVDAEPGSWEFVRKGLKEGREGWEESVPELRRSVVEAAERRDRERQAADGS